MKVYPVEFGIGAGVSENQNDGLSDGRKSFPIGLAVLTQYRSVTASTPGSQPASHVAVAITLNALAKASSLKRKERRKTPETVANWLFAQTTHVVGSKSNFAWWVACGA